MKNRVSIGEFEEIVMLTIGILGEEAYGLAIKREIEKRLERRVSMGALHTGLYRLEEKGFLTSRLGEPTKERGGKQKRYFRVTVSGQKILRDVLDSRIRLWKDIPTGSFEWLPDNL